MTSVTIALTRYKEPNWLLGQTLESLARLQRVAAEVLVLDQNASDETAAFAERLCTESVRFRYIQIPERSLSYARNYAIQKASSDIILYIDCDAHAHKAWAFHLSHSLLLAGVGVAGGRIWAKWHNRPPLLAKAKIVQEQYSLLDLGDGEFEFPKVVGANFGLNRKRLRGEAYFDERLGRRDGLLLGGEETDMCERVLKQGLSVRYNGKAVVYHQILPERTRYRWIMKRIYYAGIGRATRGGRPSPTHHLGLWDYAVLPVILPWYGAGYIFGRLSRR